MNDDERRETLAKGAITKVEVALGCPRWYWLHLGGLVVKIDARSLQELHHTVGHALESVDELQANLALAMGR